RIMTDANFSTPPRRTGLTPRRIALLGSVAAVAAAMLLGGPNGFRQLQPAPFTGVAQAAETTLQHPADFTDLIAKVKPAVISVRVKMQAQNSSDEGGSSLRPGSPMQKFFQQFGGDGFGQQFGRQFRAPQALQGEGSGFFVSADGYAVTNNHVVD